MDPVNHRRPPRDAQFARYLRDVVALIEQFADTLVKFARMVSPRCGSVARFRARAPDGVALSGPTGGGPRAEPNSAASLAARTPLSLRSMPMRRF